MPSAWTRPPWAEPGLFLGQRGAASIMLTGLPATVATAWLQLCRLAGQSLATLASYRPGLRSAPPPPR